MNYLSMVSFEKASPEIKDIFLMLKNKMGKIPNLYASVANSPVTLEAILSYGDKLKEGEFNLKEIEVIALAVGQENRCNYCLGAHTAIAKSNGFSDDKILEIRRGRFTEEKIDSLARLSKEIVSTKGNPSQETIKQFFEVGYSKAALVDLVALISLNVFTNYFNHIVKTKIDFPETKPLQRV